MNVPTYLLLNQTMQHSALYSSTKSKNRFVDFHDSGYSPPKNYIGLNGYPKTKYARRIDYKRPDRERISHQANETILSAIYNRIAIDVALLHFAHIKMDEDDRFIDEMNTDLNNCFNLSSNLDQTPFDFFKNLVIMLLDEGDIAVVPVETDKDPFLTDSYDIGSLRYGKIVQWEPDRVKVRLYNEQTGIFEEIFCHKKYTAILENPFYTTMNEPNSVAMRLKQKLAMLDILDKQQSSGKLDLIIQLPFVIKSDYQKKQAENRKKEIEMQLTDSKYGIAYTDGTERITQLNRAVESNLPPQITELKKELIDRLYMDQTIIDGTATEETKIAYYNRIIEPICTCICTEFKRKWLSKAAITQRQSIEFFRDPFKLVPVSQIADIADKFTRNEIMSSNEIRSIIGMQPSDDPAADELRNKNLNQNAPTDYGMTEDQNLEGEDNSEAISALDDLDTQIDEFISQLDSG